MSYPYLRVKRLKTNFFEFEEKLIQELAPIKSIEEIKSKEVLRKVKNRRENLHEYTVRDLRRICRRKKVVQKGPKADIVDRIVEREIVGTTSEYNTIGPHWWFFDEVFGQGAHEAFFTCVCGQSQELKLSIYGEKAPYPERQRRGFCVKPNGQLTPSIRCDYKACLFHFWGALEDFDPKEWPGHYKVDYYTPFEKLEHVDWHPRCHSAASKLWNPNWCG